MLFLGAKQPLQINLSFSRFSEHLLSKVESYVIELAFNVKLLEVELPLDPSCPSVGRLSRGSVYMLLALVLLCSLFFRKSSKKCQINKK